jgi:hypothetical protein
MAGLSPVDRWRVGQLTEKEKVMLRGLPPEARPAFLQACRMIGDDLFRSVDARLMLVRIAVETRDLHLLSVLMLDTDPAVRAAAGWGADEVDGLRRRRTHHKAVLEAEAFREKWRKGRARVPFAGFRYGPPLA